MSTPTQQTRPRRLLALGLRIGLVACLLWQCQRLTDPALLNPSDFVQYWSAAVVHGAGGDPYDPNQIFPLQQGLGCPEDRPIMMYCPPWTLSLLLPLRWLDYGTARLVWLLFHLGTVLLCADRLWALVGGSPRLRFVAWLVSLAFFPTLIVLRMGQLGPIMLLGVVGFLHWARQGHWGRAGAATLLLAVKPHLFIPLWIVLGLWAVRERRWTLLQGGVLAGLAATLLAVAVNPDILGHYLKAMETRAPRECLSPTLGTVLRLALGWEHFWLQFLPPLVGIVWSVAFWVRQRRDWDWSRQTAPLLLISLLSAPYGAWAFDLVVLLVPVLDGAARVCRRRDRRVPWIVGYGGINVLALLLNGLGWDGFWFLWLTPVVMVTYYGLAHPSTPVGIRAKHHSSPILQG